MKISAKTIGIVQLDYRTVLPLQGDLKTLSPVSERPRIEKLYRGFVPVVFVENSDVEIITVMMNRAKGVHGVLPMSQIVLFLLSRGESVEKICEMGMDREEVMRLAQSQGITKDAVFNNLQYSNSWSPK